MKRITLAILVLAALAFGLVLSGCDSSADGGGSGVDGDDFSLVGTWVSDFGFTLNFTDSKVAVTVDNYDWTWTGDYTFEFERDDIGTVYGDGVEPEKVGTLTITNLAYQTEVMSSYTRYIAIISRSYLFLQFQNGEQFMGDQPFRRK